jgi:1-deoxy-D-xylulose 5-phosphate reductoisomerase
LGIAAVVEEIVAQSDEGSFGDYDDVVAVDSWARRKATEACARRSS